MYMGDCLGKSVSWLRVIYKEMSMPVGRVTSVHALTPEACKRRESRQCQSGRLPRADTVGAATVGGMNVAEL